MYDKQKQEACFLCPRACGAHRSRGEIGYCGAGASVRIARAAQHFWEEPCLCTPEHGSGAVFFSGCALGCIYCQNRDISMRGKGRDISVSRLTEIFFELEKGGAVNLNLVTPDHYAYEIAEALHAYKRGGGTLPVILNTGGYILPQTLSVFAPYVDIFLPDFKYITPSLAEELSHAPDYPDVAKRAIESMVHAAGEPVFDPQTGLMKKGVIVRQLLLPHHVKEAKAITAYLYTTYRDRIYLSFMNQFTPVTPIPTLDRGVTHREYQRWLSFALSLGVKNGFTQDFGTAKESFIPLFDETGV